VDCAESRGSTTDLADVEDAEVVLGERPVRAEVWPGASWPEKWMRMVPVRIGEDWMGDGIGISV
jgi:hypothetical protein